MEEGGSRLERSWAEAGKASGSELLVVVISLLSSLMGKLRQRGEMERSTWRSIILSLLRRICDGLLLYFWLFEFSSHEFFSRVTDLNPEVRMPNVQVSFTMSF